MTTATTHFNSEGEQITISPALSPEFEGQPILTIHDDPPPAGTGRLAPMLLDQGTRDWLRTQLDELDRRDQ